MSASCAIYDKYIVHSRPLVVLVDEHPNPVDVFVDRLRFGQAHRHPVFPAVAADACQNADCRFSLVLAFFHRVGHIFFLSGHCSDSKVIATFLLVSFFYFLEFFFYFNVKTFWKFLHP